ncbi:MAG TPA: large conductance mechanosensitive channel protein MscL [Alphaproteobacteria bacterium]|nr:large conductance mechanosensitive channel protein MscL [Rhodospirillaceae bacterium]HRJ11692.1 large conductance mechanosensitive channel protein MscL [Alphaproteobacteria bacterium]
MLKEFQKFIMRGNVVDLAVGIIIGAAFTGIVDSIVNDVIMPPLGYLLGGVDFSNFFLQISGDTTYTTLAAAKAAGAVTINYGLFANAVLKFLIVGFAVFILIKGLNKMTERFRREEAAAPTPPDNKQEILLTEIRDILKKK